METSQISNYDQDQLLCDIYKNYIEAGYDKMKQLRFDIPTVVDYRKLVFSRVVENIIKRETTLDEKTIEKFKKFIQ